MAKAPQVLISVKPVQPKLSTQDAQKRANIFEKLAGGSASAGINPKETLGKLPALLKDQAAKLPAHGSEASLDKARVGSNLINRTPSSTSLEQRMKDGSGLGRGDSLGLLGAAHKQSKDELLVKPGGGAPQSSVGRVQQRDQYSIQGDSFLMSGPATGRRAMKWRNDDGMPSESEKAEMQAEALADLWAIGFGALIGHQANGEAAQHLGKYVANADASRTILRDFSAGASSDPNTYYGAALGSACAVLGNVTNPAKPLAAGCVVASVVSAADKYTGEAITNEVSKVFEAVGDAIGFSEWLQTPSSSSPSFAMPRPPRYQTDEGGPIDPETLSKINVLQQLVHPNKPLAPDPDPRHADPLTNPQRGDAADSARVSAPDQSIFGGVNQGVICPGPEQFKALVTPGHVDFLTGFQQKTDALINPSRHEDGSVGGPVLGAPGGASIGQNGFTSISTDGLSERPVVVFSLGQVPSVANGFQAISTDGLSERSGAGQTLTGLVQGIASADPFAATLPTTIMF